MDNTILIFVSIGGHWRMVCSLWVGVRVQASHNLGRIEG